MLRTKAKNGDFVRAIVAVVFLCGFGLGYVVSIAAGGGPTGLVAGAAVTLGFQYGLRHAQRSIEVAATRRRLRQELIRARVAVEVQSAALEGITRQFDGR